ncbi:MFS transporter [Amycolatopsis palatopharyngis]|uniref:MFS transporter n=1 Tax=Amycolatopsis palatopharyngis TaxID=187982 RepID=UPI000E240C04|nr:MFS transporter [Amycolatopsis palatopharyngis]
MYIASARHVEGPGTSAIPSSQAGRFVSGNVVALGTVSLITDVSSEMVTAILPIYLVVGLGFSPLQFGLVNGVYSGVTALVRVFGGHLADRWQRRKAVAATGYGLSAVAKLGLIAVGNSVAGTAGVLAADRTGKGLRTAPRDALISLSSTPATVARSFAVHRTMDTVGAFLGPLVAFLLLWTVAGNYLATNRYDVVFFASFCLAALGVLVLVLFVRDPPVPADRRAPVRLRAATGLLSDARYRGLLGWAALLGLVTIGDAFLYLLLQQLLQLPATYFALLPLGSAAVFLLIAVPVGRVADRRGRWPVFLAGHGALLGAYVLLCSGTSGLALVAGTLVLHGIFYACTDGVLMAAAAPLLPERLRASGLGLLQTGQALATLASSVLFGVAWAALGPRTAVALAVAALTAVLLAALVLRPLTDLTGGRT